MKSRYPDSPHLDGFITEAIHHIGTIDIASRFSTNGVFEDVVLVWGEESYNYAYYWGTPTHPLEWHSDIQWAPQGPDLEEAKRLAESLYNLLS